jgi:hypothetical protein
MRAWMEGIQEVPGVWALLFWSYVILGNESPTQRNLKKPAGN